jgi:transposase InsO family protein
VVVLCRCLEVSRSGFYAWLGRPESKRAVDDRRFSFEVRVAYQESRRTYGSPRIWKHLQARGMRIGRHRVARLMRAQDLRGRQPAKYVQTTNSKHGNPVAPNLVNRVFQASRPNAVWAADITYLATAQGWLYLAVIIDLYSRRVVGWAMSDRIDAQLAIAALRMALVRRSPSEGLIFHSDRGCQYASFDYQQLLKKHSIIPSMSRLGDCWDNAVAESFFSTLKSELDLSPSSSRQVIEHLVAEYIESFYNSKRLHSTLGYVSPVMFESKAA